MVAGDHHPFQGQGDSAVLRFHKDFDVQKNDDVAMNRLRLLFNANEVTLGQYAERTRYFILRH